MSEQEWAIYDTLESLMKICEKNGFKFFRGYDGEVKIIANKKPYAKDVCFFKAESFKEALAFMKGYEQHIEEANNNDK